LRKRLLPPAVGEELQTEPAGLPSSSFLLGGDF
jgi:hypothetical protein